MIPLPTLRRGRKVVKRGRHYRLGKPVKAHKVKVPDPKAKKKSRVDRTPENWKGSPTHKPSGKTEVIKPNLLDSFASSRPFRDPDWGAKRRT